MNGLIRMDRCIYVYMCNVYTVLLFICVRACIHECTWHESVSVCRACVRVAYMHGIYIRACVSCQQVVLLN